MHYKLCDSRPCVLNHLYSMKSVGLFYIAVIALFVSHAHAGWFSDDPFANISECVYKDEDNHEIRQNYTRAMVWTCLLGLGDTNHDKILTLKEIKAARKSHLNWKEKMAAPWGQKMIDNCSPHKRAKLLTKSTFMNCKKSKCIGNKRDICRLRGLCARELDATVAPKRWIVNNFYE